MKLGVCLVIAVSLCFLALAVVPAWAQEEGTEPAPAPAEEAPAPAPAAEEEAPAPKKTTLWTTVKDGGLVMIPIGMFSVAMVVLIVEQFLRFSKKRFLPQPVIQGITKAIDAKDLKHAYQICNQNPLFLTKIIKAGLEKAHTREEPVIRAAIEDEASREGESLHVANHYLSIVAVVSPMLGLFGTVVGMKILFDGIAYEKALGDPTRLAGGVGRARIATAATTSAALTKGVSLFIVCFPDPGLPYDHIVPGMKVIHFQGRQAPSSQ